MRSSIDKFVLERWCISLVDLVELAHEEAPYLGVNTTIRA